MNRKQLIAVLVVIQNAAVNHNRDIMTFAGFCGGLSELSDYVWMHFTSLPADDRPRIVEAARAIAA